MHAEPLETTIPNQGDDAVSKVSCFVEVALPMRLSHKWVAYACRTARVSKPRWNRTTSTWTSTGEGENGEQETISMTASPDNMSIRILTEWAAPAGTPAETPTARRLATAFVTTMRDSMRLRTELRNSYTRIRTTQPL